MNIVSDYSTETAEAAQHGQKRPREDEGSMSHKYSRVEQASEQNTSTGAARIGESALPKKTADSDGTISLIPQISNFTTIRRTYTFCGTTWLNNLINGVADANAWASFPWENYAIWMSDRDLLEAYNSFQFFKVKNCHMSIGNAQCFTQIGSGTTPIAIPSGNGKVILYRDDNYYTDLNQNLPFTAGSGPTFPVGSVGTSITQVQFDALRNSFSQGGYESDTTVFLPNSNVLALNGQTQSNQNSQAINSNNENVRQIRMGSGHTTSINWQYGSKYWRTTAEMVTDQVRMQAASGTVATPNRADELLGYIKMSNISTSATIASQRLETPGFVNDGTVALNTSIKVLIPPVDPLEVPGVVNGATLLYTTPTPQPRMWLHIIPDIGVQGSVGTSSVQLDFKISFTVEYQGHLPVTNNRQASGNFSCSINQPKNFRPVFVPINKNFTT